MEFMRELVIGALSRGEVTVTVSDDAARHLEGVCCRTLERIREIVADDTLDDPECFQRIEQIVCEFEALGIGCGTRHDFG